MPLAHSVPHPHASIATAGARVDSERREEYGSHGIAHREGLEPGSLHVAGMGETVAR